MYNTCVIVKPVQSNLHKAIAKETVLIYNGDFLYKFFGEDTLPLEVSLRTISLFYAIHEHCVDSVSAIHCRYKALYHFLKTKLTLKIYWIFTQLSCLTFFILHFLLFRCKFSSSAKIRSNLYCNILQYNQLVLQNVLWYIDCH